MAQAEVIPGPPRLPRRSKVSEEYLQQLKMRYEQLKGSTERTNCEGHWQELGELVSPRKVDFVGMRTAGEKQSNKMFDSTGVQANEMLAAGLHGMATNPASKWFSLRLVEGQTQNEDGSRSDIHEDQEVQDYLSDTEEVMWQRIYQPGTNFTTALHEGYLDLGCFGTAVIFIGQRDDGGLLFECLPLASCLIAENVDGRVDTLFRKTDYTVRQMMQMKAQQGWTVSPKVQDMYEQKKYDEKVVVIHAVFPREERDPERKGGDNLPFASCYFELDACQLLSMSGFDEFPFLVPRWSKYAGEVYGRSPGMTALPDIKMLQAMTLSKAKLIQKAADPPVWLRDDGLVGQAKNIPGGISYFRGDPSSGVYVQPTPLQGLQALLADIEMIRQQILRTFFADIMRMTDRANMTATEVVQRTAEQMRLFGPLIGRLESEMLGPLVERVYGILSRLQLLPELPAKISEKEMTVEYVSPIATAQKQQSANGIVQAMQLVAAIYGPELAVQEAMKKIPPDKAIMWAWDLFNNDPDLLADEESTEQAAQLQQAQQALAIGSPAMDMVAQGAKSVKDIATAHSQEGVDLRQLMGETMGAIQGSPNAQTQLKGLLNGAGAEIPEEA